MYIYILKNQNIFTEMYRCADQILEIHLLKTRLEASIGNIHVRGMQIVVNILHIYR